MQGYLKGISKIEQKVLPTEETLKELEPRWVYWPGWIHTYNKCIDDAICNCCGYQHKIVYNTPNNLADYCPRCGRKMRKEGY